MRIALIGYGKMGQLIHQIALERGHQVVGVIDPFLVESQLNDGLNRLRLNDGMMNGVIGFDSEEFRSADVAIEFTTPATAAENIRKAWEAGVPVVSGTTGWNIEKLKVESLKFKESTPDGGSLKFISNGSSVQVVDEQGKVWLVWKSNFSVGVNVFFDLNKVLAQALADYPQYKPAITETHHIHKLDKPSGTAVTLAEGIHSLPPYSSAPLPPIESVREGEVAGIHTVTWDSEEDTITITHSAKSRRGFALGAVLEAEKLME